VATTDAAYVARSRRRADKGREWVKNVREHVGEYEKTGAVVRGEVRVRGDAASSRKTAWRSVADGTGASQRYSPIVDKSASSWSSYGPSSS
jgi:hypothetical protein